MVRSVSAAVTVASTLLSLGPGVALTFSRVQAAEAAVAAVGRREVDDLVGRERGAMRLEQKKPNE